jgi:hypothetical protein
MALIFQNWVTLWGALFGGRVFPFPQAGVANPLTRP